MGIRPTAAWEYKDLRYPDDADAIAHVYCSVQGMNYTDVLPPVAPSEMAQLRRLRRLYPIPHPRSVER